MTPEQQSAMDKKEVKIIKADNGFLVRAFPHFMVFDTIDGAFLFIKQYLHKEQETK
jgi:hypothetical protein